MMPPLLHIHGMLFADGSSEADDVVIVGTTDALSSLREAIDDALLDGVGSAGVQTNRNEHYFVRVTRDNTDANGPVWPRRMHPLHPSADSDQILPTQPPKPEDAP